MQAPQLENPTTWLWCAYWFAQHLDAIGRNADAMALADLILKHTPTLIEGYTLKAKLFKVINLVHTAFLLALVLYCTCTVYCRAD